MSAIEPEQAKRPDAKPEATAEVTADLAATEPDPDATREPCAQPAAGTDTTAYERPAGSSPPTGDEETQVGLSRAPITGAPAGDETCGYAPLPSSDMPADMEATRLHETGRRISDTDVEFTVGAGGGPTRYILKKFHAKGGMGEIWL